MYLIFLGEPPLTHALVVPVIRLKNSRVETIQDGIQHFYRDMLEIFKDDWERYGPNSPAEISVKESSLSELYEIILLNEDQKIIIHPVRETKREQERELCYHLNYETDGGLRIDFMALLVDEKIFGDSCHVIYDSNITEKDGVIIHRPNVVDEEGCCEEETDAEIETMVEKEKVLEEDEAVEEIGFIDENDQWIAIFP